MQNKEEIVSLDDYSQYTVEDLDPLVLELEIEGGENFTEERRGYFLRNNQVASKI